MEKSVIISRHNAAVEFIARQLAGDEFYFVCEGWGKDPVVATSAEDIPVGMWIAEVVVQRHFHESGLGFGDETEICIPVIGENASPDDVRGKVVYGNLPLHLASLADRVYAVEFAGRPPRGREYSLQEMEAAGARLAGYVVRRLED